ncbi:hypothetical protein [uncultured Oscillibacter sp.]|uniref:hypothetical protein n=1 Tax=uncultured Oscillibacter sp. TaxID=876091 RepID=UPI0025D63E66|nr:hypothetical protein [uncultured Oscillibacter sp.]
MKSWSKRELALAVLVIFAAVIAPYVVTRSLGRLLPGSATLFLLFLYAWVAALVMGVAFFFWARKGRRVWPWILVLAVCLGLFVLWGMNLNLMADITGYYNTEATAFRLIYLIVCYIGMLAAAVLAAAVAWVLRKINY